MNRFITFSAILMGLAQFILVANVLYSWFKGPKIGRNPWGANGLEWSAPSPPGHGNFDVPPVCYHGPHEYSSPLVDDKDFLMQTDPPLQAKELIAEGETSTSAETTA
jgi:cytochrome c oxidase subunit 1